MEAVDEYSSEVMLEEGARLLTVLGCIVEDDVHRACGILRDRDGIVVAATGALASETEDWGHLRLMLEIEMLLIQLVGAGVGEK